MPVPDVSRPGRVDGKAAVSFPAVTTAISVLTVPVNTLYRLRSCYVANISGSPAVATVLIQRSAVNYHLAPGVTIPAKSVYTAINIDEAAYMEPGDILYVQTGTASAITFHISYEIIT